MKTIIWKGIIYDSLEYFNLTRQKGTFIVKSKITGENTNNKWIAGLEF